MALKIIDGPNKKGQFLLALGGMKVWVDGDKLKPTKAPAKKGGNRSSRRGQNAKTDTRSGQGTVDLHGLSAAQALSSLEQAIDRALLNGLAQIEIIHGIGMLNFLLVDIVKAETQIQGIGQFQRA